MPLVSMYVFGVGFLYPAYRMLADRNVPESYAAWLDYWPVFALLFAGTEILQTVCSILVPLLWMFQAAGATALVLSTPHGPYFINKHVLLPCFRRYEHNFKMVETRLRTAVAGYVERHGPRLVFEYLFKEMQAAAAAAAVDPRPTTQPATETWGPQPPTKED